MKLGKPPLPKGGKTRKFQEKIKKRERVEFFLIYFLYFDSFEIDLFGL